MLLSQKHSRVLVPFQSLIHNDVRVHTLTKLTVTPQKIKEARTISSECYENTEKGYGAKAGE